MSIDDSPSADTDPLEKRREWWLFLFLVVVFFPLLTVFAVGGYGMAVWLVHMLTGPPGI